MTVIDGVETDDGVDEPNDWIDPYDDEPEDNYEDDLPDFIDAMGLFCDPLSGRVF